MHNPPSVLNNIGDTYSNEVLEYNAIAWSTNTLNKECYHYNGLNIIMTYRIHGIFGGGFNLVVWRIT